MASTAPRCMDLRQPGAAVLCRASTASQQPHPRWQRQPTRCQAVRPTPAQPPPQLDPDANSSSSRRALLLGMAASATFGQAPVAHADLRDFLQSRQQIYALAPIRVGQQRLKEAAELLKSAKDENSRRAVLTLIRDASLNCYQFETRGDDTLEARMSVIQQGFPGVDVCTYRLIAKNVTNIMPSRDSGLKAEVDDSLMALLRSFNLLDDAMERASEGDDVASSRVDERLELVQKNLDRFDASIKSCLHMP